MKIILPEVSRKKGALVIDQKTCKNSCFFCSDLKRTVPDDEVLEIERRLEKEIVALKTRGITHIEISGQDPIEYRGIDILIARLKKEDFSKVELLTHGRNLAEPEMVRRLAAAGLDELRIPIYGPASEIHDRVTLSKGSFLESIRGLENVKKLAPKIHIVLTTMVAKPNCEHIIETIKLMAGFSKLLILTAPFPKGYIPYTEWMVPFKVIRKQLLLAKKYCAESGVYLHFLDIPDCVFGYSAPYIQNAGGPPSTSSEWIIPGVDRAQENPRFPAYRKKVKIDGCISCRSASTCDGFFEKYVELFGAEDFKPIPGGGR